MKLKHFKYFESLLKAKICQTSVPDINVSIKSIKVLA